MSSSDIPYEDQFQHIEGGEYEFRKSHALNISLPLHTHHSMDVSHRRISKNTGPEDLGPGRVERAGSRESETAMGRKEQETGQEETEEEAGPPKLLSYSSKDKFSEPQVYRSTSGAKPPAAPEGKQEGQQEGGGSGLEAKAE